MTLYLVPTPIGNLEDITLRALRVLKDVDLIACEDTRHTRKLLNHFDIHTPTVSCHEHNERERIGLILDRLAEGKSVALVSDAGMPGISDPGALVVRAAVAAGHSVTALPGPSAAATALAASGLPTETFHFVGFPPAKSGARRAVLADVKGIRATLIFYEAPHRLRAFLDDARTILGGDRPAVAARELSKLHEEYRRGSLADLAAQFTAQDPRGEFVVLIGGAAEGDTVDAPIAEESLRDAVERLMNVHGIAANAAIKRLSQERGIPKRDLYRQWLDETGRTNE